MAEVKMRRFMGRADADILFIRPVEEADRKDGYDDKLIEPWARRDVEEMYAELLNLVTVIQNRPLKDLVLNMLHRHGKVFKTHPAACSIHHAYRGGLLEHTLLVARTALALGTIYNGAYPQGVNRDILLAGAILHDIGKLAEIDPGSVKTFTLEGNLVGHIVLGHAMIREAAAEIAGLEPADLVHLEHLILSHQGRPEWGSPQEPKSAEAIILHYADDCDAKMSIFFGALAQDAAGEDFTTPRNVLGRRFYKKGGPEPAAPGDSGKQTELEL
jgi:3'-5' exoribonuclease